MLISPIFFWFKIIGNSVCFPACRSHFHLFCTLLCYHTLLPPIISAVVSFYPSNSHLYTTTSVVIPLLLGYVVVLLMCFIDSTYITFTQLDSSSRSLVTDLPGDF